MLAAPPWMPRAPPPWWAYSAAPPTIPVSGPPPLGGLGSRICATSGGTLGVTTGIGDSAGSLDEAPAARLLLPPLLLLPPPLGDKAVLRRFASRSFTLRDCGSSVAQEERR